MAKIRERLESLYRGGLFWIFGSSIISQMGGFLSSVLVIRYLPKTDYGEYVGANNIYSYLFIFSGLGLVNAILQFCSENVTEQRKASIYSYAFWRGNFFNIFLAVLVMAGSVYAQSFIGRQASYYLFLMFGLPMVNYLNSYCQIVLRVRRDNVRYAIINMVYAVFMVGGNLLFTKLVGVKGIIYATYISNVLSAMLGFFLLRQGYFLQYIQTNKVPLLNREKKEVLQYSVLCALTNLTSTALVLVDVTCLNLLSLDSEVLADYKTASMFPTALLFIQNCLVVYFYPYLAEQFSIGLQAFRSLFLKLIKLFLLLGLGISVFLFIFAPWIIKSLYGKQYLSCIPVFRILCINYFFLASFRKLFGNAIAAMKQVKINLYHTIIAGILDVVLNLLFIPFFGSLGAAIATVFTSACLTLLEIFYFRLHVFCEK